MFRYLLLYALLGGVLVATAADKKFYSIDEITMAYPDAELIIEKLQDITIVTCVKCGEKNENLIFHYSKATECSNTDTYCGSGGDGTTTGGSGGGRDKVR